MVDSSLNIGGVLREKGGVGSHCNRHGIATDLESDVERDSSGGLEHNTGNCLLLKILLIDRDGICRRVERAEAIDTRRVCLAGLLNPGLSVSYRDGRPRNECSGMVHD